MMMHAALAEAAAAKARIADQELQMPAGSAQESMRPMDTMRAEAPRSQEVEEMRRRYPEEYKGYLRAAVRAIVRQDPLMRRKLYDILGCKPETGPS